MASLAQTTQTTRKLLKWAGIAFAAFLVIRLILFPLGGVLLNLFFPKEPPKPTTAFQKLPRISFPAGIQSLGFTYTIRTTTGTLPPTCVFNKCLPNQDATQPVNIADRVNVYPITQSAAQFSSYEFIKQKAERIGFTGEGSAVSSVIYLWKDPKDEDKKLTINIITGTFTITSSIDPGDQPPPTTQEAVTVAKRVLSSISLLPNDLDDLKTKITFFKLQNGNVLQTRSLSDSNFVRVDFYRKPLANLPIVYPKTEQSLMSFNVVRRGFEASQQIADASFSHKSIDQTKGSTYPIKTAQEAYNQLTNGNAYIASIPTAKTIAIKKIYLAYYEGNDDLAFILPVFVFEGDNGFVAYVSAVKEEWEE